MWIKQNGHTYRDRVNILKIASLYLSRRDKKYPYSVFGWGMFWGNVMFWRNWNIWGKFHCLDNNLNNVQNDGNL